MTAPVAPTSTPASPPLGGPHDVGSWAWSQRTDGRLGARDYAQLIGQYLTQRAGQLRSQPARGRCTLVERPSSPLVDAATQLAADQIDPAIIGHSERTWAYAAAALAFHGTSYDEEALYVAALLHDVSLRPGDTSPSVPCFAVAGGRRARDLLIGWNVTPSRATMIAEAITLHMNPRVAPRFGPIAAGLSIGLLADTVGVGHDLLTDDARAQLLADWPREPGSATLCRHARAQSDANPHTRARLLHRAGFSRMLAAHPLDRPGR